MDTHKFYVGQLVQLAPAFSFNVQGGTYQVKRHLPVRDGEFAYQIKSPNEPHERVARETELKVSELAE
jgi:hypothetical protein